MLENGAVVDGDAVVASDLVMANTATITGHALVGGAAELSQDAQVAGGISTEPWPPGLCECGFDLASAISAASLVNDNALLASRADLRPFLVGGALVLSATATVTLPAGTFYLTGLTVRNGGALAVEPGARVTLIVHGPVEVSNTGRLAFPPSLGAEVRVITDARTPIQLENATDSALDLFAPESDVNLVNTALLLGGIVGRTITVQNTGRLLREVTSREVRRSSLACKP